MAFAQGRREGFDWWDYPLTAVGSRTCSLPARAVGAAPLTPGFSSTGGPQRARLLSLGVSDKLTNRPVS